jgi:phosphotransferase system  glucose/maltose/N-acetylglucosamine-specific IIC component
MENAKTKFKVIVLWILLLIGMILHFNYHVSAIFYGIDVKRPNADGTIPLMAHILKTVFYHFPMIFVVALLYLKTKWFRGVMFVISLAYTVYHVFHVLGEFKKPKLDLAQIPLLSLVLIFSLLLNKESWKYFKYEK